MDNIPTFINRKHGREEIKYEHPDLAPILNETYGIMVYQEQVMKIAQVLGGYTLGQADKLRKVMGKKLRDEIPHQREMFVNGALKNGIAEDTAKTIFDQMEKFASYGFNKSHAAAYSLISYQTAYLKAHYPVEFMCAVMDFDIINTDKIALYTDEVHKMGFKVLPPDINYSNALFKVENGNIRFALSGVKGVGEANMNAIVEEREKNGVFKSLSDFIHRVDIKQINRRQLEQLIKAGAFDCLDKNRAKLYANIDSILRHIAADCEMKNSAQTSLFGTQELSADIKLDGKASWADLEQLQYEAEAIGFSLSAHPLDVYADSVERLGIKTFNEAISGMKDGDKILANLAGCVQSFSKRQGKKGMYAILRVSDTTSAYDGFVFERELPQAQAAIAAGVPLFLQARIEKNGDDAPPRIIFNTVRTLDEEITQNSKGLIIEIADVSAVRPIREVLSHEHFGPYKIYLKPELEDWNVRIQLKNSYALDNGRIMTDIRAIPGVTLVKEL
jgi:DNA polymerase-3 subunit alpha